MGWAPVQRIGKGVSAASNTIGSSDGWNKPTAGNLLVATANSDATVTNSAVGGSAWIAGPSVVDGNGTYLWYKFSDGTETTITMTPSVSDTIVGTICEYSGIAAFPFDAQNSSTLASSPGFATSSTSVTTAQDGDLIIAVACAHTGSGSSGPDPANPVWSNGFNNVLTATTGGGHGTIDCYTFYGELEAGTAGTYSTACTWTSGTVGDRQQLMIAFKAATGPQVVEVGTTAYQPSNTATLTTASFTPGDNTLLVAYGAMGNGTGGAISLGAVTDNLGGTWKRMAGDVATNGGLAEVWCRDIATGAPMTVTWDPGGTGASGNSLIVKWYAGAKPAASQPGATALNAGVSSYSKAIVTTVAGSLVVGAFGRATSGVTLTANASTTILGQVQGSAGDVSALFRASALTATPGSTTLGFTNASAVANYIALAEVLPVTAIDTGSYVETFWPGGGMIGPPQMFQFMQDPRSDDLGTPANVLSAVIGQATDTSTAQPITSSKTMAIGMATGGSLAQPLLRRKAGALGLATAVGTAQPLARAKSRVLGLPTTTSTALALVLPQKVAIGQATSAGIAQPVTRQKSRTLGPAPGAGAAFSLTGGKRLGVSIASGAATAFSLGRSKSRAIGQPVGSSVAQPMVGLAHLKAVGQASGGSTALSLSRLKSRVLGQVTGSGLARNLGTGIKAAVGQASGGSTAQPITGRKLTTIGQAAAGSVALGLGRVHSRVLGLPTSGATAQPIAARKKNLLLGQATANGQALGFQGLGTKLIGQVTSGSIAQALQRVKARLLGQATSAASSSAVVGLKRASVGLAAGSNLAQPLTRVHSRTIGQPTAAGVAFALGRRRSAGVGQAQGYHLALSITKFEIHVARNANVIVTVVPAGSVVSLANSTEVDLARPTISVTLD